MSERSFSPRPNRRRFVAAPVATPEPTVPDNFDDDEDLPLLTEVVDLKGAPSPLLTPPLPPVFNTDDADTIVANVEASLRAQLPALITAATATLEEDLKRGLTALVEDTLRDVLSDYLPLPEPEDEADLDEAIDATTEAAGEPAASAGNDAAAVHRDPAQPAGGDPV